MNDSLFEIFLLRIHFGNIEIYAASGLAAHSESSFIEFPGRLQTADGIIVVSHCCECVSELLMNKCVRYVLFSQVFLIHFKCFL